MPRVFIVSSNRLDTDILFGKRCKMKTLAVLSGITTAETLETVRKEGSIELLPDYYADSVKDLLECLK